MKDDTRNNLLTQISREKGKNKKIVVGGMRSRMTGKVIKSVTISQKQMQELEELNKFLHNNNHITQSDLNYLLNEKVYNSKFLRKVNDLLPDLVCELKQHGPTYVAYYYANRVQVNKQIEKALP